jgi:4-coumarate--CoA ligase
MQVQPSVPKTAVAAADKCGIPRNHILQFSDRPNAPVDGISDWREMIGSPEEADAYRWTRMAEDESETSIATVNYSLGTTGLPNGVCVSYYSLIANAEQHIVIKFHGFSHDQHKMPKERWVGFLPLH